MWVPVSGIEMPGIHITRIKNTIMRILYCKNNRNNETIVQNMK
jgi:hypothetical protein